MSMFMKTNTTMTPPVHAGKPRLHHHKHHHVAVHKAGHHHAPPSTPANHGGTQEGN
jgi:hypothetical protein